MSTPKGRYWINEFPLTDFVDTYTHAGKYPLARRNLRFRYRMNPASKEVKFTQARVFHDEADLARYIKSMADVLISIEVGALYPANGMHQKEIKELGVYQKELVFDVDLNDYAELRSCGCGTEKRCCNQCFTLFLCKVAVPIIYSVYRVRDWQSAMLNFSGGRGIHVWIFDDRVMNYGVEEREAVVAFFEHPPVDLLHAWMRDIYLPVWNEYFLAAAAATFSDAYLQMLESKYLLPGFRDVLALHHHDATTPIASIPGKTLAEKWTYLQNICDPLSFERKSTSILHEILKPRLDKKVTTDIHHLVKSPYSLHATTDFIATVMEWDDPKLEQTFPK